MHKELDEKGGLHKHQYGFRQDKSTLQAPETINRLYKNRDCKPCAIIAIDVRNTFNTASHGFIFKESRNRKVSKYLVNMVSSYLKNRKIILDDAEEIETGIGVLQGSVLRPMLWNVFI